MDYLLRRSASALAVLVLASVAIPSQILASDAASPATERASRYTAKDTLNIGKVVKEEARRIFDKLAWTPGEFQVTVRPGVHRVGTRQPTDADAVVTFASPLPRGNDSTAAVNRVVMEWYRAQDENGQPLSADAPAMLMLHILDGRMYLERGIARTYAKQGIHTFIMHMPSYGARGIDRSKLDGTLFFELCSQGVADARRARDAIAALPGIDADHISLQGMSFGGFIATSAAAVDAAFDQTFVFLAGGQLYDMFMNGQRESRMIRERMEASGVTPDELRELCHTLELTHLAHRLPAERTWLFSARADQVVPAANAKALATAAGLPASHHVWLSGDHYTVVLHLPWAMNTVVEKVRAQLAN